MADDAEVDDDLVRDMTEVLTSSVLDSMADGRAYTERPKRWQQFKGQTTPRRYVTPDGQIIQAFTFAFDPTPEQELQIARSFGARHKGFNGTLDQMKKDIENLRETGESGKPPTFHSLRKRENAEKGTVCVNDTTGEV